MVPVVNAIVKSAYDDKTDNREGEACVTAVLRESARSIVHVTKLLHSPHTRVSIVKSNQFQYR